MRKAGRGSSLHLVHHRLLHLSSDVELPQFEHRGAIDLSPPAQQQQQLAKTASSSPTFQPDSGSSAKIEEWINRWKDDPAYHNGEIFYQVALQRREEDKPETWDVQSVRLCHVPLSTSDSFVLHLTPSAKSVIDRQGRGDDGSKSESFDDRDSLVEWFSYYVDPVPRDGSCSPATLSKTTKKGKKQPQAPPLSNSTVEVRDVRYTPKVALRAPVPMTPTGEPIKPPPEKSFLQKYWMYIGAFLLVLAVAAPPEAEGGPDNGAGAGARRK
ncbi:hypothetical protein M407DRAFT_244958 [Tulasnella calospora MUT 4182]|uniref:ER membrane protein complex subunit 10 n=1 Tax=Tulasnella calospora MUT 4182 TaxID=1051891 RepID=A0A0C3QDS2_9AGAM|nr:hypothetical protein M407DRAFT_244958 [Tulasnella calospora MUT 4182]